MSKEYPSWRADPAYVCPACRAWVRPINRDGDTADIHDGDKITCYACTVAFVVEPLLRVVKGGRR